MKDRTLALLTTASFVGVIWLIWFAHRVLEQPARQSGPALVERSQLVAIYAPASLIRFAQAHDSFDSPDELVGAIHEARLSKSWLALTYINQLSDGTSSKHSVIAHPGEIQHMHLFPSIIEALRVLSGKSENPIHGVEIGRIADSQFEEDPVSVLADMEEADR